jgi:hypothetical protein
MRLYNDVTADVNRSVEMEAVQRWIDRFICGVMPMQRVVGNRISLTTGLPVSPQEAAAKAQSAQVCPFVQQSINQNHYWIEESFLGNNDRAQIEALMRQRAVEFVNQAPAYDPNPTKNPAGSQHWFKTYMTVFPNVVHPQGTQHLFEDIHQALKPDFVEAGLMLGQFYYRCPQEAIYNPSWTHAVLSMPFPCFAIRYLVRHDHLFTGTPPAPTAVSYRKYFP